MNWNAKRYLLECLQSIVDTSGFLRSETIVVDNGSSDGSVDAVQTQFPSTKVIENRDNLGFAKANNIGIQVSTGTYIALVNSDVVVLDGCFEALFTYMKRHPHAGMIGPKMLGPGGEVRRSIMSFPNLGNSVFRAFALDSFFPASRLFGQYLMAYREFKAVREVDVLNGFFLMIRREAFDEVGLFDERFFIYGEDIDLCRRFERRRWLRIYHPGAAAIHYGGASSARQPIRFFIEMQKANLHYWRKQYGVTGSLAYKGVILIHHALRVLGYALRCAVLPRPSAYVRYKMKRSRKTIRWLLARLWIW